MKAVLHLKKSCMQITNCKSCLMSKQKLHLKLFINVSKNTQMFFSFTQLNWTGGIRATKMPMLNAMIFKFLLWSVRLSMK